MSTPVGPYSPVVRAGDLVVTAGQVGIVDGALADGFAAQVTQAMRNVATVLAAEGVTWSDVVKTTVFLVDMDDYAAMNEAYVAYLDAEVGEHRPARSAVAVAALPIGSLVEIEAWAHRPA